MEPDVKRMKVGLEINEGGIQHQAISQTSLSSVKPVEKVASDFQGIYSSSSLPTNESFDQNYHGMYDNERNDNHMDTTTFGSLPSSEPSTSLQLTSLPTTTQNPCTSEIAGKKDIITEKNSHLSRADQKTSVQNGSGQKLESIIGRLSSDRVVATLSENDEDALICKADASTQTFPDFVKIVKCLVFRRMKQLEQSLIRDAVTDSVLNGKLVDLQKENRDLRKSIRRLQDKLDLIIQSLKSQDESNTINRIKELLEVPHNQQTGDVATDNSSPVRKQSAVVSPYHVQSAKAETHTHGVKLRELPTRLQRETGEVTVALGKVAPGQSISVHDNANSFVPMPIQCNPITKHGPQVKYVPQRFHQSPHHSGTQPSQFINLAQGGIVMQRLPIQRARGLEYVSRPQAGPVIYTTQSVQVTGPRMSTIPPQPQQASQHGNQRPMVSPSGIGTRLSQPGQLTRPGGNLVHMQGSSPQTVHYIPHNVMPYMTQIQQNLSFSGHRTFSQGSNSEMREHLAMPQPNTLHAEHQSFHPAASIPPPPYQMPRTQNEQTSISQKVHINQLNSNLVSRAQSDQPLPPKLQVNITVSGNGIVLSWDFESEPVVKVPAIECYHLFASQDSPTPPILSSEWKKIGVVKALPLPMACTLTQFVSGNSYHFAVLAVDVNGREGPLSNACTVRLNN